jgi:hypothetical protein
MGKAKAGKAPSVKGTQAQLRMIKEFQCAGCVCGSDPKDCGAFKLAVVEDTFWHGAMFHCDGHIPGTNVLGVRSGLLYLGLPTGFNRVGMRFMHGCNAPGEEPGASRVRLFLTPSYPTWDALNVAVWAMRQDGHLFVRTYMPRINCAYVDVVEGGDLKHCPNAIDVSKLVEEMD